MNYYERYIENGYSEEQAFYLSEIRTTQQIMVDLGKNGIYMPTLLINSLLSLIILPYEKAKARDNNRVFSGKFSTFENQMGISPIIFQPIKSCDGSNVKYNNKTTNTFINKIRNGIAHQNISVSISDNRNFSITIKNKYRNKECNKCLKKECMSKGIKKENGGVIDFEITVSLEQLKKLADYVANAYLNAIGGNNEHINQ